MRLKRHMALFAMGFLGPLLAGGAATAQRLVTDISQREIAITSSFHGTSLLLFGAVQSESIFDGGLAESDIIIVVRGPEQPVVVRKKEPVAGIWVNTKAVTFADVPGYYAVATSGPLDRIVSPALRKSSAIGLTDLDLQPTEIDGASEAEVPVYREAIIRQRREANLFLSNEGGVSVLAQTLFRVNLAFPANVPVGEYRVEAYLLQNGRIVSAQSSALSINKSGIERSIFMLAYDSPFFYGLAAVAVAVLAGWLAAALWRR